MVWEIIWSKNAQEDLRQIVQYLTDFWSEQLALKFYNDTMRQIDTLAQMPFIGRASGKDPSVRSILLSRHNALYYSIQGNIVFLLDIVDTREDTDKNPFEDS
jgi:plasmid stabilization system protein ParE